MMFNMERAARQSLEDQVENLKKQNEELRKSLNTMKESGSKTTVIKIDANKPMPAPEKEYRSSFEEDSTVYLGKQRKDTITDNKLD